MADRLIRLGDLAAALASAGASPVREGAAVAWLRLDVPLLIRDLPEGDALWATRVRQGPRPWLGGVFARWRRARRRRAGWAPHHLQLRWTPRRIDALVDGRRIARIPLDPIRSNQEGQDR